MNDIDLAGIRNSRPVACFSLRRERRAVASTVAATLTIGLCAVWASSSRATPQPKSAGSSDAHGETLLLQQGCQSGNGVMCNDLGVSFLHGVGAPADSSLALRAFERSCRLGSADGCGNLGALYEVGVAVAPSFAHASRLYERACDMGCALGCSNLGALYARGLGVSRDVEEAQRLFALACETGSAAGCNNLLQLPGSH